MSGEGSKVEKNKNVSSEKNNYKEYVNSESRKAWKSKGSKKFKEKKIMVSFNDYTSTSSSSSEVETIHTKQRHKKNWLNRLILTCCLTLITFLATLHLLCFWFHLKSPHFDGTNYSKWRHNMRGHLYSLHPSIWNVVKVGMEISDSDDEDYP